MKNIYTMGNHFTKEETIPAVIEYTKMIGGEITNGEIAAFVFGRFGIRFGNLSDYIAGIRDWDKRFIKGASRGVHIYVDDSNYWNLEEVVFEDTSFWKIIVNGEQTEGRLSVLDGEFFWAKGEDISDLFASKEEAVQDFIDREI